MPAFRYPKSHRLRSKQDFQSVYQESFRIVGNSFLLRLRPHKGCPRLGVLVSKKFGGAPHRNRVRRILRELFRLNPPALNVDVHFSQIRPFIQWGKIKKELHLFFTLLQDKTYLKINPPEQGKEIFLKSYSPSAPSGMGVKMAIGFILAYKRFVSPSLGPGCRYLPTCSAYALEAFRLHGFFKGFTLALRRILSCNPLGGSGFDPVPGSRACQEPSKEGRQKYKNRHKKYKK